MTQTIDVTLHEKGESAMGAKYERTFVVAVPVERVWQAFVDPRQREAWMSPPGRDPLEHPEAQYPADGFPKLELKLGELQEHQRLSWSHKQTTRSGSDAWLETTVTFEAVERGTRVTITRSGFGEGQEWELYAQSTSLGFDHSIIDLIAYLETGVNVSRHFSTRSSIGASMMERGWGIEILEAVPGGFAAEAGMRAGDLLISIGGAGIYHRSDVWFLQREHGPGEELEVTFVRDGALLRGRGRLSEANYTETHGGMGGA